MKKKLPFIACFLLLLLCVVQQSYIKHLQSAKLEHSPIPRQTWDPEKLAPMLEPPVGAKSMRTDMDSMQLTGNWYHGTPEENAPSGFLANLWLDAGEVDFHQWDPPQAIQGDPPLKLEDRVLKVAGHYAKQIEAAIPGAVLVSPSERFGVRGSLHNMLLVEHRDGLIVVSVSYVGNDDRTISDLMRVVVMSRNPVKRSHHDQS